MHRIDKPNHVSNMFAMANPGTGAPGTQLGADWPNAVQEEICEVIESAGAPLNKADNTQLYTAIQALITAKIGLIDFTKSLAATGWQKLPSGLIIQWGSYLAVSSDIRTISMPLTFPAAGVFCAHHFSVGFNGWVPHAAFVSNSQLLLEPAAFQASVNPTTTHFWFAIGY